MNTLLKGIIICILILAAFFAAAATASALSLQIRGGKASGDTGTGYDVGLDLFFYEGRSFDFFVGYDMISTSDTYDVTLSGPGTFSATIDAETSAFMIGLRYKMQTVSSWKPFFSLGLARLSTKLSPKPNLESYTVEESSTGMRLGIGVDIGMSDNWSVGLEASLLSGVPYYESGFFGSGLMLDSYGVVTQLDLGLRYFFD